MDLSPAFASFDAYNAKDPNQERIGDLLVSKEVLYGLRMTERLYQYSLDASDAIKLAARCQHIGRWESARSAYPMDRKGYLKWRSDLAIHHANIAGGILEKLNYPKDLVKQVKFLLQKKQLKHNEETQLLEDVIFLVFLEHYIEDFAAKHEDPKVIDIIMKTLKKVSSSAINASSSIAVSERVEGLIKKAASLL
ncbi:MAG: hypothetical protein ACI97P_002500 [Arcticibacterium sp.]|jgi:hypothetical protein